MTGETPSDLHGTARSLSASKVNGDGPWHSQEPRPGHDASSASRTWEETEGVLADIDRIAEDVRARRSWNAPREAPDSGPGIRDASVPPTPVVRVPSSGVSLAEGTAPPIASHEGAAPTAGPAERTPRNPGRPRGSGEPPEGPARERPGAVLPVATPSRSAASRGDPPFLEPREEAIGLPGAPAQPPPAPSRIPADTTSGEGRPPRYAQFTLERYNRTVNTLKDRHGTVGALTLLLSALIGLILVEIVLNSPVTYPPVWIAALPLVWIVPLPFFLLSFRGTHRVIYRNHLNLGETR